MRRDRSRILAVLLGMAFAAGPIGATCVECCPKGESRPSVIAPPACCGHCAPTLERSSDPVTIAAKKAIAGPQFVGAVREPPTRIGRIERLHSLTPHLFSLLASLPASRAPLRL